MFWQNLLWYKVNISENPEKSNLSNSGELLRIIFAFDLLLGALTLHLGKYNGKISEKTFWNELIHNVL